MNVAYIRSSSGDVILTSTKESLGRPDDLELYLSQSKNFRKVTQTGQSKTGLDLLMQLQQTKALGSITSNPKNKRKGKTKNMHALM